MCYTHGAALSLTGLERDILRDLVPCDDFDDYAQALSFTPVSGDVEEREHDASHHRALAADPILDAIGHLGVTCGDVYARVVEATSGQTLADEAHAAYHETCRAAGFIVVSHLLDAGLIRLGDGR